MIALARRCGVATPVIRDITHDSIVMENIRGSMLKLVLNDENVYNAGVAVGRLHSGGIIHGDLTTSNIIVADDTGSGASKPYVIDFGLAYNSTELESRGVDLHVYAATVTTLSTARHALPAEVRT